MTTLSSTPPTTRWLNARYPPSNVAQSSERSGVVYTGCSFGSPLLVLGITSIAAATIDRTVTDRRIRGVSDRGMSRIVDARRIENPSCRMFVVVGPALAPLA